VHPHQPKTPWSSATALRGAPEKRGALEVPQENCGAHIGTEATLLSRTESSWGEAGRGIHECERVTRAATASEVALHQWSGIGDM